MSDVLTAFQEYRPHIGNNAERTKCLKRIDAVPTHHCGNHSKCRWEKVCSYIALKNKHPMWTDVEIQAERVKSSRFQGQDMGLSLHGINVIKRVLFCRFEKKSINRVVKCMSSNPAESFLGVSANFRKVSGFAWNIQIFGDHASSWLLLSWQGQYRKDT